MFTRLSLFVLSFLLLAAVSAASCEEKLKALIVDGQNNHGVWPKTTQMMKRYLEESGLFQVEIATTAPNGTDENYKPEFSKYNVVISNYNGAPWPKETQAAFVDYIKNGGGFVVVHAADNAFGDWKEYNEMIGLGGWGGRNEKSGPYVFYNDEGKLVKDDSPGGGGHHGSQHPFEIIVRDGDHPITKGMPSSWMHEKDELYDFLRGPATSMHILATAFASKDQGGSGRHEPMLMTIEYGKGRVFHTPMGHGDYSQECVGFIASLLRGAEWAATGKVTQEIPKDFPSAEKVSVRKFEEKKEADKKTSQKAPVKNSRELRQVNAVAKAADQAKWVTYEEGEGLGKGKYIVLISGDEEYRSEEGLPQLGKILAVHHGFKCTVLFSQNPEDGTIDPNNQTNIPGIELVKDADAVIMLLRFRELPDSDMKIIDDYVNSGKPIIGLRTSTHAFNYSRNKNSPYAKYSFNSGGEWKGGFGQEVLGDTWISHHGGHKSEATRGVINAELKDHPILRGVKEVFGPTDVYGIRNLGDDADILLRGQVVAGMKPDDPPVEGAKNDPMMPLFWTRIYKGNQGKETRVVCTTMGASVDLESEGLRRALVNSVYWGLGMEDQIPEKSNVDIVGEYKPTFYGFNSFTKGVKVSDHQLKQ